MTEDLGGEAEGEQFVTMRVVEGTIVRERGTGEVVEDETKEFDEEGRRHFREGKREGLPREADE